MAEVTRLGEAQHQHGRRHARHRKRIETPLHKIVSENLEIWLPWQEAAERPVPGYVGILASSAMP
jgi:hypothetical protein